MADLITGLTSYPTSVDTATTLQNATDDIIAEHINGPNAAVVAIETELGTGLRGAAATLAARLAVVLGVDGGLLYGTTLPSPAPSNLPHFFFNTSNETLYLRNTNTAQYDVIASTAVLADYVRKSTDQTITGTLTFAPGATGVPFIVGPNAVDQNVPGLDADSVDGHDLDQDLLIASSPTFVTVTGSTSLKTDTIVEKTATAGVTIDSVLIKDNTVMATSVTTDTVSEKTATAGVTIDGVLLKDSQPYCDVINEKTPAAGVTIDGVLLKDSQVTTDVINEKTSAAGVTLDGVLLKDSQVTTDVINEKTSAAGVTVDGCLIKDGVAATAKNISVFGEVSASGTTGDTSLASLDVLTGDKILINSYFSVGILAGGYYIAATVNKASGTATIRFGDSGTSLTNNVQISSSAVGGHHHAGTISGVITVTGDGTLVLHQTIVHTNSGTISIVSNDLHAFFIKKV